MSSNDTPYSDSEYAEYLADWQALSSAGRETLRALHTNGPLWDGDVPSKSGRNELLRLKLAAKVIVKNEEGYQACTYRGHRVLRCAEPNRFGPAWQIARNAIDAALRGEGER